MYLALKSVICLGIFYIFYKLFLEHENLGHFKRFYLLASLLCGLALPFVTYQFHLPFTNVDPHYPVSFDPIHAQTGIDPLLQTHHIGLALYMLVCIVLLGRFIINLSALSNTIRRSQKIRLNKQTLVLVEPNAVPHTFLQYILLSKNKFYNRQIDEKILSHEKAHAYQWHTLDILFSEFCMILFWFNPFLHLIIRSIRLNHEFLADAKPIKSVSVTDYQEFLISTIEGRQSHHQFAHYINYSITKKRLSMMTMKTSKSRAMLKMSMAILLIALAILFAPETVYSQEAATETEFKEYVDILKKSMDRNAVVRILKKDAKRLHEIHSKLTDDQKAKLTEQFLPPLPPPPTAPAPPAVMTPSAPPAAPAPPATVMPPVPPTPPAPPIPSVTKGSNYFLDGKKVNYDAAKKALEQKHIQSIDYNSNTDTYRIKTIKNK